MFKDEKLYLWKNGDKEYWAFSELYPVDKNGDPLVLGEPVGYALLKTPPKEPTMDKELIEKALRMCQEIKSCDPRFDYEIGVILAALEAKPTYTRADWSKEAVYNPATAPKITDEMIKLSEDMDAEYYKERDAYDPFANTALAIADVSMRTKPTDATLVIIESPYAGDIERNTLYARRAMRDSLDRGENPIASHLIYTQPNILDEFNPAERKRGIDAGFAWWCKADKIIFYTDYGYSNGMNAAIERVKSQGKTYEIRQIGKNKPTDAPDKDEVFRRFDLIIQSGDHDANGVTFGRPHTQYLRHSDIQTIRAALKQTPAVDLKMVLSLLKDGMNSTGTGTYHYHRMAEAVSILEAAGVK